MLSEGRQPIRKRGSFPGRHGSVVRASPCAPRVLGFDFGPRACDCVAGSVPSPGQAVCRRQPVNMPLSHPCFSLVLFLPSALSKNQWKMYLQ